MTTRNCWVPVGTRLPPRLAPDFVSSYFTQDADSEREEGRFLVWMPDEIRENLRDEADEFMAAYGVTPSGNFEAPAPARLGGKNILEVVGDMDQRPVLAQALRFGAHRNCHAMPQALPRSLPPGTGSCWPLSPRRLGPSPPRPGLGEGAGG